jgi:glycosyltransferase involved in cell wall biosynthesis
MAATVFFLLPYPLNRAPSQRFRVEAYFDILDRQDIAYATGCFWSVEGITAIYKSGHPGSKAFHLFKGLAVRFFQLITGIRGARFVFIHREAAPVGPPVFEWIIAKVLHKKIIYDFDDAIWISDVSNRNALASFFKAFWKVKYICTWSNKISVGNKYLNNWALQYNSRVVYNPTCVDMDRRFNIIKNQATEKVVIGWTGSHSTLKYLDLIKEVLEELEGEFDFEFLVICDKKPDWKIKSLRFLPWNEASEVRDLLEINIGIMPLEKDAWSEGKCGFKLIQYLALGIPAVATPVGVNSQIIVPGENGYLCETPSEWKSALITLLRQTSLRQMMGEAGRVKMLKEFSIRANENNFLSLFS